MPIISSISGLRATLGDSLTPELIVKYSKAFANYLPMGKIVLGTDGRVSGNWIELIVLGTLSAMGRDVVRLGVAPTPTIQLAVINQSAAGGICITASHNPANWNGMKFLNANGVFLDESENDEFGKIIDQIESISSECSEFGKPLYFNNAIDNHINSVIKLGLFSDKKLIEKIQNRKFRAVIDAVNASGSEAIPKLIRILGGEAIELHCNGSGKFPHTPEPLSENLIELSEAVIKENADIGIAVDPDADRLVLINEKGEPIGEEKTVALAIDAVFQFNDKKNLIAVVNHSTSALAEFVASKYNGKVLRSPVGEINVVRLMQQSGAIVGGEGSGGVILPESHYGRDSIVGIALVLALMAYQNLTLSQIIASYPEFAMVKLKKEFKGDFRKSSESFLNRFTSSHSNSIVDIIQEDGIKIIASDGWFQVRSSNTEPIIRVIAEYYTKDKAINIANEVISYFDQK